MFFSLKLMGFYFYNKMVGNKKEESQQGTLDYKWAKCITGGMGGGINSNKIPYREKYK
jgi:hypothetical protein